jgi:flagellar motor switch protein FliM
VSTLTEQELDALLKSAQKPAAGAPAAAEVHPYDLTSHDRIIRGRLPALDAANERLAREFAAALSRALRCEVGATAHPVSITRFQEFAAYLPQPACINVLRLDAAGHFAAWALDRAVAARLLELLLGGRADAPAPEAPPAREFTGAEQAALRRLSGIFAAALKEAWHEQVPVAPEHVRSETDPRQVRVAAPTDVVVLGDLEVEVGPVRGRAQLAVPYGVVEAHRDRLGAGAPTPAGAQLQRAAPAIPVTLVAELGRRRLPAAEVLGLKPGDVLRLDGGEHDPVRVLISGRAVALGLAVRRGGTLALEITAGPMELKEASDGR